MQKNNLTLIYCVGYCFFLTFNICLVTFPCLLLDLSLVTVLKIANIIVNVMSCLRSHKHALICPKHAIWVFMMQQG